MCPNSAVPPLCHHNEQRGDSGWEQGGRGREGLGDSQVGAGEQREGKFDTNSSVFPCKSSLEASGCCTGVPITSAIPRHPFYKIPESVRLEKLSKPGL